MKNSKLLTQFNLPSYLHGKSFAEASKAIEDKFKDREDAVSQSTKEKLLERLRDAQEFYKAEEARKLAEHAEMNNKLDVLNSITDSNIQGDDEELEDTQNIQENPEQEIQEENGLPPQLGQMFAWGGNLYSVNKFANGGSLDEEQSILDLSKLTPLGLQQYREMLPGSTSQDMMTSHIDQSVANVEGSQVSSSSPGIGAYVGAATGAIDMIQGLDGSNGNTNTLSAGIGGVAKGASAGAAFGPWGAAIGGVLGGVTGMIGSGNAQKKLKKKQIKEARNNTAGNGFELAMGGYIDQNQYFGGGNPIKGSKLYNLNKNLVYQQAQPHLNDLNYSLNLDDINSVKGLQKTMGLKEDGMYGKDTHNALLNYQKNQLRLQPTPKLINDNSAPSYNFNTPTPTTTSVENISKPENQTDENYRDIAILSNGDSQQEDENQNKYNPLELLRYSPAIMNAYQLATMTSPEISPLYENQNKYNPQLVDTELLKNDIRRQSQDTNRAILQNNDNVGSTRSSLLGSQVNQITGLSDAMLKADRINASEMTKKQDFDNQVDIQNIEYRTSKDNTDARNRGAYATEKSKLLSKIGDDLGGIGKEEWSKMMSDRMFDFDSNGKFKNGKKSSTSILRGSSKKKSNTTTTSDSPITSEQNNIVAEKVNDITDKYEFNKFQSQLAGILAYNTAMGKFDPIQFGNAMMDIKKMGEDDIKKMMKDISSISKKSKISKK